MRPHESEGALPLLLDRVIQMRDIEGVKCPRAGFVVLTHENGMNYVIQTACKTWGCIKCSKDRLNATRERMIIGCLRQEQLCLITVTLGTGRGIETDALGVRKAQEVWLKSLKGHGRKLTWFKVPELTKMMIPHLHLIAGGWKLKSQRTRCTPVEFKGYTLKWLAYCQDEVECLQHECARRWYEASGSWVVDVREVYEPMGACFYLTKYLVKSMLDREELERLGFARRWSCSRNWPKPENHGLVGSLENGWVRTERYGKHEDYKGQLAKNALQAGKGKTQFIVDPLLEDFHNKRIEAAQMARLGALQRAIQ